MGQVLNILSLPFIEQQIEELKHAIERRKQEPRPTAAKLRRIFAKPGASDVSVAPASNGLSTEDLMTLAALEHARGADPEHVRSLYRAAAEEWEPVIAAMDFKPRTIDQDTSLPSYAKELERDFDAKVTKTRTSDGPEYHIRYRAMPQPFWNDVFWYVLPSAALSGDPKLARRLARLYKVEQPHRIDSTDARFVVLRHLLAGDDAAAEAVSKRLKPYYQKAFAPDLIEFPLGVVRNDPKLLLKGVRALGTRFKGVWNEQKLQQRCDKMMSSYSMRWVKTREKMWDIVRGDLVSMRWLISPFALAYLNVAAWRGMEPPFGQPKAFSEWVPLSLCQAVPAT